MATREGVFRRRAACAVLTAVLVFISSACVHSTTIVSIPPDAEVYLGEASEPAGRTPFTTSRTGEPIRVQDGERAVSFRLDEQFDWGLATVNTGLACCGSAAILAGLGGGLYLLGTGLGLAMPVLGPIIAVLGAPPACFGTALWSVVGGLACGALVLPVQAFSLAQAGPDRVEVDLGRGVVVSQPPNRAVVVDPTPASQAASRPATDETAPGAASAPAGP